jgi:hypothetical protein
MADSKLVSAKATVSTACSSCDKSQEHTLHFVSFVLLLSLVHLLCFQKPTQDPKIQSATYSCKFCGAGNQINLNLSQLVSISTTSEIETRTYAPSVIQRPTFATQDQVFEYLATEEAKTKVVAHEGNYDFLMMTVATTCANPQCKQTDVMELKFVSNLFPLLIRFLNMLGPSFSAYQG